jgi:hypothetical protein
MNRKLPPMPVQPTMPLSDLEHAYQDGYTHGSALTQRRRRYPSDALLYRTREHTILDHLYGAGYHNGAQARANAIAEYLDAHPEVDA